MGPTTTRGALAPAIAALLALSISCGSVETENHEQALTFRETQQTASGAPTPRPSSGPDEAAVAVPPVQEELRKAARGDTADAADAASAASEHADCRNDASAAGVIACAYARLLAVRSARVAHRQNMDRLGGVRRVWAPELATMSALEAARYREERVREANCEESKGERLCDLVDTLSDRTVGFSSFAGGVRTTDGVFVPPSTFRISDGDLFDDRPRPYVSASAGRSLDLEDRVRANIRKASNLGPALMMPDSCCRDRPMFSRVFDTHLAQIERLPDAEVDGLAAFHYRGEYPFQAGRKQTAEWWIAVGSGLPLIVVQQEHRGEHEIRSVYRFSQFDTEVDAHDSDR